MADRSWAASFIALASCVLLAGCAAPYTYYGDGTCGGPISLSGRFADQPTCADCGEMPVTPATAAAPTGMIKRALTCGGGCGEIYWGEWINDPPEPCDACNEHGDWMGTRCCPPSGWSRLWSGIHGQRAGAARCDSCSESAGDTSQGVDIDGLAIEVPPAGVLEAPPEIDAPDNLATAPTYEAPARVAAKPVERHPQSRLVRRARR